MSNAAQNDPLYRLSTLIETETWQASHLVMREIVQAGMQEIARLRRFERDALEALAPFAERGKAEFTTGDYRNPEPAPDSQIFGNELFLTVGDLRRATLVHACFQKAGG